MGRGIEYNCAQCGYKFSAMTGVGFMFPIVYRETVEKGRNGELGTEMESFFQEHEDGAIDAENVMLRCEDCGNLDQNMDLSMYVLKSEQPPRKHGRWSVAVPQEGIQYVDREDLSKYYTKYAEYPHKCKKCNGRMRVVNNAETIVCPKCKIPLDMDGFCWD